MKTTLVLLTLLFCQTAFSQTKINSKFYDTLEFKELDYGQAQTKGKISNKDSKSPTGLHGWVKDFEIINKTDSIQLLPKANFGAVYIVNAKDTVTIDVIIEWIFPKKMTNEKGKTFKSIKYKTKRPTNIPSASSYSIDESYEMIKGNWEMNIYLENSKVYSRTFILY